MYNQVPNQVKVDTTSTTSYMPPPATQPHFPVQQSGYSPQPGGHPPHGGYHPQQIGYPTHPTGYPTAPVQDQPTYTTPVQQQPPHTTQNTNTTVVVQQKPAAVVVQRPRGWSTGMFACFDDMGVCLLGLFSCLCCLPIIECNLSSLAGECCCVGILCPIALRTKIRTRHNIQGTILDDGCTMACCHYCAMCQMAREVHLYGM